jgi:hypothetical protein
MVSDIDLTNSYQTSLGGRIELSCKAKAEGVTFRGMSGGGVFKDQRLVGIINASSPPGVAAITDFTPIDLLRETYRALYPRRARAAGIGRIDEPGLPSECRYDAAGLAERAEKTPSQR